MDFHRTTNGTIAWLREHYGRDFLDETFRRFARDVYRHLREQLAQGETEALVDHWTYFLDREGGDYTLERAGATVTLTVHRCPAVSYLRGRGIDVDPDFCRQTLVVNETLAEGTPFTITTEVIGDGRCVQTLSRREP
jgi:predicted ArsR family transcriptional regulator